MGAGRDGIEPVLSQLEWRCIGPHRGGRVVAVAGDPAHPTVFYFGACAGGIWKTSDGGIYWENVSDGYFTTAAVGAIAVAPSDPNVIFAGTGERITLSHSAEDRSIFAHGALTAARWGHGKKPGLYSMTDVLGL